QGAVTPAVQAGAAGVSERPASEWRRYVDGFIAEHKLQPAQQAAANSILAELEKRAEPVHRNSDERIRKLREQLARTAADDERQRLSRELARANGPLSQMFAELKQRLDALLTREQRETGGGRKAATP